MTENNLDEPIKSIEEWREKIFVNKKINYQSEILNNKPDRLSSLLAQRIIDDIRK
jgi:hypothetical protein